jgi:hypothetical protein
MKKHFLLSFMLGLGVVLIIAACASTPSSPTPSADAISTLAYLQVYAMQTQTALAASPTPSTTPIPTETPTAAATPTSVEPTTPPKRPVTTAFAPCLKGPGSQYTHITNIAAKKYVTFVGVGSVPGWYVIRDPYFRNICWIEAIYLKLDPKMDVSTYPVVTPPSP